MALPSFGRVRDNISNIERTKVKRGKECVSAIVMWHLMWSLMNMPIFLKRQMFIIYQQLMIKFLFFFYQKINTKIAAIR